VEKDYIFGLPFYMCFPMGRVNLGKVLKTKKIPQKSGKFEKGY